MIYTRWQTEKYQRLKRELKTREEKGERERPKNSGFENSEEKVTWKNDQ